MLFTKTQYNKNGLRVEKSMKSSGVIVNEQTIPELDKKDYYVKHTRPLDGDAPKQFIKAYFHGDRLCVRKNQPNSWCGYVAKTAEKWYPVESVTEYMINRIGQVLGLNMNEVRLVRANTQIRFLSKYFLSEGQRLIHGAEICGEYLEDMDLAHQIANDKKSARALFTFQFIQDAIKAVYPVYATELVNELVKMIVFDAIAGNNDRHFYNWGVIDNIRKSGNPPKFAPLYDSARGLLWNVSDENITDQLKNYRTGGKKIANYIINASPRISINENNDVNHFELVSLLVQTDAGYREIVAALTTNKQEDAVLKMLEKECFNWFIKERREAVTLILKERFNKIRGLL